MSDSAARELEGKHALITGASRGIGATIACELSAAGAAVTLVSRDAERLAQVAASCAGETLVLTADVSDEEAVHGAVDAARARFGPAAILVNNAGAAQSAPFHRLQTAQWSEMLALNLTGTFLCTRAVVSDMTAAGWGRIVNVASTAGLTGYAYVAAYCAAKHGVIGLTRSLARELAASGVTVNAVCPGYTETDMLEHALDTISTTTGRSREEARKVLLRNNPQGRFVQPAEVAATVRWLCSAGAASINGQALAIAGGEVM